MRNQLIISYLIFASCILLSTSSVCADTKKSLFIHAQPYSFPYNLNLKPENTALLIIDMQKDFCSEGGYVDQMGYDVSLARAAVEPIQNLLKYARQVPGLTIIYTREGHHPDLSDLPENKHWRSMQMGAEIGSQEPLEEFLLEVKMVGK